MTLIWTSCGKCGIIESLKATISNQCIRCGKIRIVTKTWKEGTITYSLSVCPDSECQASIDEGLRKKQEHLTMLKEHALKRKQERQQMGRKKVLPL